MNRLRVSLVINTSERYVTLAINFVLIALVSRILTPHDIGIAAVGATALALIECMRDIPTTYLIQRREIDAHDRQTAFTTMILATVSISLTVIFTADDIAAFYGDPAIAGYLYVLTLALVPGPFERPLMAIMRRDMQFSRLALINICVVLVNAVTTISLALVGMTYMSFAWGLFAGNVTALVLSMAIGRQPRTFRLNLSRLRPALQIGGYAIMTDLTGKAVDLVTYLIIGRGPKLNDVGFYSRAANLSMLPEKLFVTGITHVAFPAIAEFARQGRDIRPVLLRGLSLTSVLQFPAYAMLAILAYPVVDVVLGAQWKDVSPILQILAIAGLVSITSPLVQPTYMAVGAFRDLFVVNILLFPIRISIVAAAAFGGLYWLAWSVVVRAVIAELVFLLRLRVHVRVELRDVLRSLTPSLVVTLATIAGPIGLMAYRGFDFDLSIGMSIAAVIAAAIGWLSGVFLTEHPIRNEIMTVVIFGYRKLLKTISPAAI